MNHSLPILLAGVLLATAASAQFPTPAPQPATPATLPDGATSRGNAKLTGTVVDSTSGKPVEFASIALIDPQTKKPIDGTVANENGQFTLPKLPPGQFGLLISFVGYRNKTVSSVKLDRRGDVNIGTIRLIPDVRTLSEVNVVGQAAIVEEKVDRIVYNADKDITNKGGDASDVMRKVPLLSVDLDGNVSLRGSSNVRVLINNKPSTIVASSVADALKQIPADMIKTVEVITSPSAKYDAEGSAGIINIITKKTSLQGFTLNLDSGVGNRGANLGLNGNLRTGKMGFSLSGFGRGNYNVKGAFDNTQQTFGANSSTTRQTADNRNNGLFGQYTLGWDYDISKTSALTASLRYGARNNYQYQDNFLTRTVSASGFFPSLSDRNVKTTDLSGTLDANIDYTKTYAKPQQEFSVSAQYSRNNRTNDFTADIMNPATNFETTQFRQQNLNRSYNQESTIRADYQTPLGKNQLLEFGGKGIFRKVESNYQYNFANGPDAAFVIDPNRPANTLNYDQNIAATYLSYTLTTKNKYTIKAGTRYEYTTIRAFYDQSQSGEQAGKDLGIPSYGNLVPSINISKTLKGGKTIKLAYNRRLQRPGIQFLNPNPNSSNPLNIVQGNPLLSPELTDNLELGSSTYIKSVYINATLFARRTNNSITSVRDFDTTATGTVTSPALAQALRTTYLNIGREAAYGINLFGNATLFSKWQIGGGFDAFYADLTNNSSNLIYRASNSGFVVSGRIFTNLTLKNGWGVQGFGFMRGRQVQLQGYSGGFGFYSIGVKKDMKDKRGSFGIAGENFFNHPFTIRSASESALFSQQSVTSLYNAGVRVNFSYKFGKLSFDQPQRQRGKSGNDDLKDEGGSDNGGAAAPAAPAGGAGGGRPGGGRPRS